MKQLHRTGSLRQRQGFTNPGGGNKGGQSYNQITFNQKQGRAVILERGSYVRRGIMKLVYGTLILTAILGLCAIAGSDCPALSDAEQMANLNIGAGLFFGSAVIFTLIKRRGK